MEIQIKSKHIPMILSLDEGVIPSGVEIRKVPLRMQRDGISEAWAIAIVMLAASVPLNVFVNWLSNKLTDKRSTTITINRKEFHFDEGELIRMIEENRKIEQDKI